MCVRSDAEQGLYSLRTVTMRTIHGKSALHYVSVLRCPRNHKMEQTKQRHICHNSSKSMSQVYQ